MNTEPRAWRPLRQRLPQWRWLYGGGFWALLLLNVADWSGLNSYVADETSRAGQLSTSGAMVLGLSLLASVLLGVLVQRQWPSSLSYRLFVPSIVLVIAFLALVAPFGQTWIDGSETVGVGIFLAWMAGVVLGDPTARIKPTGVVAASETEPSTRAS